MVKIIDFVQFYCMKSAGMAEMDRIDRKLLNLLQENASRTNAQLADEVGLAPSSCLRRIRRLEAAGLILRTVAILDPAKSGKGLKVIIAVELARHDEPSRRQFLDWRRASRPSSRPMASPARPM